VRVGEPLAIEVMSLTKSYGSVRALRGVNLEVRKGEIFGFLGPNGAGKTTTIRILLDLIRPDSGTIRVLGINPQSNPVDVRARVGYLPGELQLDDNLTPEANLKLLSHLRRETADWTFVQQLAERLELDLKRPVKNLSRGNKRKVGVMQALMHKPELLLLDEPTTALDPLMQQETLRLIQEARAGGATVFFSSHFINEVEHIADRAAIIRQGLVAEVVEIPELLTRALRRVRIRFRQPVDMQPLTSLPGAQVLGQDDQTSLSLQIVGDMDALIKKLASYPVVDLITERPSLEEIFMAYYEVGNKEDMP
jgi:ABC-2 type transport system ATP-binding protein